MCREPEEFRDALVFLDDLERHQEWEDDWAEDNSKIQRLKMVQRRIRSTASAGMDGWPPCAVKELPKEALPMILAFFQLCCQVRCYHWGWQVSHP